jgi:alkanesulfonate monooxygenase SsuD/methylene tetrahydromethanopterin reductase-like flavin-dependent oxidoreductase (luciferase family)
MAGRRVTHQDAFLHLTDASTLVTEPPPPIWIAGFGPRMMKLTATYASGWNTAWHGPDTSVFQSQLQMFREQLAAADKSPSDVDVSVGFLVLPGEGSELEMAADRADRLRPRDSTATRAWQARERMLVGSAEKIVGALGAYSAIGATHGILNLSPTPFSLFDASLLERAAKILERDT